MAANLQQIGPSSLGAENTSPTFRARVVMDSERFRELDRRQSYYDCTQHDYKRFDFDGRIISVGQGGIAATQPLLSQEKNAWYVPLRSRRPSSPYRLGRVIVNAFTTMIFGENRFPKIRIEGDTDSQDFLQTCVRVGGLPVKMIRARTLGGAMGTACLSWCFVDGRPRYDVHNAKNIYVHSWEDRDQFIPEHVTEVFQFPKDEYDPQKKKFVRNMYWYRRDWTPNADIVFKTALVQAGREPNWEPNLDKSITHGDKLCHFVWIQNLPCDQEDGIPDYDGLYESFDAIDLLYSVIMRGATLNLDPTLKLKMDPDLVNRMGVKKGSDNALVVGKDGEAAYLELGGGSLTAGVQLFDSQRRSSLETAQCVVPDPHDIAAQGVSSVAMRMVYAPMLGKCDILREQYGGGMERILEPQLTVAQAASKRTVIIYDDEGKEHEAEQEIDLPRRVHREPKVDEAGKPTGEDEITMEKREPGEGGGIELQWGQYFATTPQDQQQIVTTLSLATAQAPFMSPQTAVEIAASAFSRDGNEEWQRVQKTNQEKQEQQAQMFPGGPGQGGPPGPPGGKPPFGKKPFGGGPPKPFGAVPGQPPPPPSGPPKSIIGGGGPPKE